MNKIAIGVGVAFMILVIGVAVGTKKTDNTLGSVAIGGEYQGTTTYNRNGAVNIANYAVLKEGNGTFGSVVITGAVAGSMSFYDATSTVTNTEWATTSLAYFPASTAAGTYTFDRIFRKGLLVVFSSATLVPTSTIMFR